MLIAGTIIVWVCVTILCSFVSLYLGIVGAVISVLALFYVFTIPTKDKVHHEDKGR